MTVFEAANLLQSFGIVTFSFPLNYAKDSSGQWKKNLKTLPKEWQKNTLEVPLKDRVHDNHNGLGLITGPVSNILAADNDNVAQFDEYLKDIGKVMPITWTTETGSGGHHYFFKWNEKFNKIKTSSKMITHKGKKLDFDVRAENGFVICPPSSAMAGQDLKTYKWIHAPGSVELAEMPDWLFEALTQKNPKKTKVTSIKSTPDISVIDSFEPSKPNSELEDFILQHYSIICDKLNDIKYDSGTDTFSIGLKEKLCLFAKREHSNNHQYLVIKKDGVMVRKCHSKKDLCDGKEFKPTKVPEVIMKELITQFKNEPIDQDLDLTKLACEEATNHVKECFAGNEDIQTLIPAENNTLIGHLTKLFGFDKCNRCNQGVFVAKVGAPHGGTWAMCNHCGAQFPDGTVKLLADFQKYQNLAKYLQINVTVNNNNYYGTSEAQEIGWNEFVNDQITVINDMNLNTFLLKAMSGTHTRVGDFFVQLFKENVVFCPETKARPWYMFTEKRGWKNVDESDIKQLLRSDVILDHFVKVQKAIKVKTGISNAEAKVKHIASVINKLETDSYKTSVLRECEALFKRDNFFTSLNQDKHLVGFNNGIYDLERGAFQPFQSNLLVTMSVGYNFDRKSMFEDEDTKNQIKEFMMSVFPNSETCMYVMKFLGSCLAGFADDQLFHFGHGTGSNGKGVLIKLMLETLGDYGGTLASSFLTGKTPEADAATPSLTNVVGKRFVGLSETVEGSKLNEQLFKSLCGQDKLVYRPLHQEAKEFEPDFKLFMVLNQLLEFKATDYAMMRRIRVIPFKSSFKENPDESKGEFLLDKSLHKKVKDWKQAFMGYLLDGYALYIKQGLIPSTEIIEATRSYEKDNDKMSQFLEEKCVLNKSQITRMSELCSSFVQWSHVHYATPEKMDGRRFSKQMRTAVSKAPWNLSESLLDGIAIVRGIMIRKASNDVSLIE